MSVRYTTRRITAKTAAYTIKKDQPDITGSLFTNRGAGGSVTFTLPAPSAPIAGVWYEFQVVANQSLIVAAASAGQLVAAGNAAADNVGFQVANAKIGGVILVICDGTSWICLGARAGGGFCVNGTEVSNVAGVTVAELAVLAGVTAGTVTASKALVVNAAKALVEGLVFLFGGAVTIPYMPTGVLDGQFSVAGVGNGADATDDTLFTFSLPANSLNANKKAIRIRLAGVTAANGNNKRIKIFIGATAVVDSAVITSNAKNWVAEVVIRRTGVGAQIAFGRFTVDGVADVLTKTTPAVDETAAQTVKGTGSSPTTSAANDVLGNDWQVEALAI